MRILLISNVISIHSIRWAKAISEIHEVLLFGFLAPPSDVIRELDGLNFLTMGINDSNPHRNYSFNKIKYLGAIPKIKKIIKEFKPDVLHAHYATSYGLMGALSGFHPFILSVWGSDVYDFPNRSIFHKMLVKYNLRKADIILSTSHIMADQTRKFTDKNVLVTPFGIDLNKFYKNRKENRSKKCEIVIGTVKTLHKKYGIAYLIKAFKIVIDRNPDIYFKLLIVGDGPDENDLKKLTRDLKIDNLTTFTGKIKQDEVPEYFNKLDIYVAVSILDSESFGVAVIEAGACELPVVVSSVGGLKEVVLDGKTGYIVPPKDPEKTANAIEILVNNKEIREEFGRNARKRISDLYNWEKNVELMNSIYLSSIKMK